MIDLQYPLVVLVNRLPWLGIKVVFVSAFGRKIVVKYWRSMTSRHNIGDFANPVDGFLAVFEACVQPQ